MSLRVCGRVVCILLLEAILLSCGDVYRPTIIPNTVITPSPSNYHAAFTANTNGGANAGTTMQVDVSGDSNAGVTNLGISPVSLAVQPAPVGAVSRVWAANPGSLSIPGSSSVSVFTAANIGGQIGQATTVNLPDGAAPQFVTSTESATMYVANSYLGAIDPNTGKQPTGTVNAIATATSAITGTIPVGLTPWTMAETPDAHKLYVGNRDDNTVTSVNTVDQSIAASIPLSGSPQWLVARGDSKRIYVIGADGILTTINSEFSSAQQDTILFTQPVGTSPTFVYFDAALNRLYIPFPTTSQVAVYNAAVDPPTLLTTINLTAPAAGGGAAPCPATGCIPVSVTGLSDGTRAYVASYFIDSSPSDCTQMLSTPPTPCIATQVTVFNELNNTVTKGISLPLMPVSSVGNCATARFRIFAASAADNTRVFVSNCDAGAVSIVTTSGDKFALNLPTPASQFSAPLVSVSSAVQNGTSTTYTYSLTSGTPLWQGMTITVSGIQNPGDTTVNPDNGIFAITSLGAGTFTVNNPAGVSTTVAQTATGVGQPPAQNPVFIVAGP